MEKDLFDLTGKVALVTGGNGGIGLGLARGIARRGGSLEIWGRNREKNEIAKALLARFGGHVTARTVDVTSPDEVVAGYDALIADHGRIDCVFANSGRPSRNVTGSTLALAIEEWHGLLAVNLHGAFHTLREGARQMIARAEAGEPGGSLVFLSSLAQFHGLAGMADYSASKAGMAAVVRTLSVELGRYGIRANTIAPGFVLTGAAAQLGEDHPFVQRFVTTTPLARHGTPEDFEGVAAYLCSDASSFHTGDTITIDGGSLAYPAYAMR